MCVPKRKDFTEDPKEEISVNQGFRAREASHPCYYAPKVGVLPILNYFHFKGCLALVYALRGCLAEY